MSLSSLFNLPSAPAQILGDNASAAQGSSNTSAAPLGDAFATYMAQQMSSGQFSKWQNLTSALANQNALGANGLGGTNNGLNNSSMDQTAGFGPSPGLSNSKSNSSPQSTQSNQSAQSGSGSSDSTSTNGSSDSSSSSSTSQASDYAAHRKFSSLNKDLTLLGDTIDSTGADSTDLSASVSTNAMLMGASLARAANQSSDATSTTLSSANGKSNSSGTGKDAGTATTAGTGTLPLVLPSIGAALQAQQNAIKAQSSQAQGGKDTNSDLKTTALSDKVQLITPNQTDTNPQSLISYARGMGLNDSQIHQLFGPDAAKGSASAGGSGGTANSASTAAIIGSGAASSGSLTSSVTSAALSSHISTTDASLSTSAALSASTDPSSSSGSLSPAASSVLGQLSNLQVQIDQAPGAIGIQSEATAATLADATQAGGKLASVGPAGLAGLNGTANNATPISTLEVLSEMDASLRPEDIAALEAHFNTTERSSGAFSGGSEGTGFSIDMNTALGAMHADASAAGFAGSGDSSGSGTNSGFGSSGDQNPQSNNANVPADMAGAYEKLSNKFANEVSTRLQQQFAQGQWKMKFALRPTSLGIVDIQLEMKDGKLAANFQSNNPLTQNLIQTNSHQLRNALQDSGITQSSVQVGSGQTNGQGSNSGQNSGVPYTYQSNPLNTQATATEEIPAADDSTITKSSNSDSQLDIFA